MKTQEVSRHIKEIREYVLQSIEAIEAVNPNWQQNEDDRKVMETWKGHKKALDELQDVLHDYDLQAAQLQAMVEKYTVATPPVKKNAGLWLCPTCGHRVNPKYSHCHWCGKKFQEDRGYGHRD